MKEQLIDTAERLFLKYGLRSVSIDDICNELHISKKTFYQYFRQKEQLVKAMLDRICEKKATAAPSYGENDNVVDVVLEQGMRFASKQSLVDRHIAFMYDLKKYYPDLMQGFVDRHNAIDRRNLTVLLNTGIRQGMVRKELNIPLITYTLSGMTSLMLDVKVEGITLSEKTKFGIDAFLRMVCSEEGLKRYEMKKAEKITL